MAPTFSRSRSRGEMAHVEAEDVGAGLEQACAIISAESEAGPSVAMIFVRRDRFIGPFLEPRHHPQRRRNLNGARPARFPAGSDR